MQCDFQGCTNEFIDSAIGLAQKTFHEIVFHGEKMIVLKVGEYTGEGVFDTWNNEEENG